MDKRSLLRQITFGERVAEEETGSLATYFVETDHWNRLYDGDIDVVYGPKGSGKSALYSLLIERVSELFDRKILLIPAENPQGAPAFRDLVADPPTSEREFMALWKLYFLCLLQTTLAEYSIKNDASKKLEAALAREGLVKSKWSLAALVRRTLDYVRGAQAVEGGIDIDPITGMPKGFKGKIIFSEPGKRDGDDLVSVDHLLSIANDALNQAGYTVWLLLDRLDVAFAEAIELEENALRALFRVYLDLRAFPAIKTKIFLRTDVWKRITSKGFREASHITRHLTIDWNRSSLLNLVVRRLLHNDAIRSGYNVAVDLAQQSVNAQEEFFYRVYPSQVDVGPNKPKTFDWLLSRTRDGTGVNAPRELIHFLNSLREVQTRRIEVGEDVPEGELLFSRPSFKLALPAVSRVRLEQTLYSEYPAVKPWLEALRGSKTSHTPESLSGIWNTAPQDARVRAEQLVTIGFFERRGSIEAPEYWVPFLYRDALEFVQGAADQGIWG
jgi:hypothetical protein